MADITALNKEIADLRRQLGEKPLTPFDPKDLDKAILAVKALRYELREASSDLDYISKSFKDSVNEMSKQNLYLNSAKKSLRGISDISRQVVDYRRGETILTEKQLKNLQNQARVKFEELKLAIKSGQLSKDNLRDAKAALDEQENFNKALNRTIEIQKEVNKEIGLLGSGLEGVGKALEKMGFSGIAKPISDAIQKTKEARFQLKLNQDVISDINKLQELQSKPYSKLSFAEKNLYSQLKTRYGTDKAANDNLKQSLEEQNKLLGTQTNKYKNIAISLKEQLTMTNMMDFMLAKMVEQFFALNKAQTEYTRETGLSYSYIDASSTGLATMAQNIKQATAMTQQFGLVAEAIFTPETIGEATEMVELMGMTSEEAGKLARIAKVNGNELKDNNEKIIATVSNFNKLNKTGISGKAVLKDLSNISDHMALSFKGDAVAMAQTASEAKKLGLTLSDVDKVAESLLNFEDSISAELEAELLTGKSINLEQARLYALNNDMAGLTKEIGNNQEIIASFSSGNRIQQDAIAKTLGLSREEMSKMIYNQQLANGLSEEQAAKLADVELSDMKRLSIQESINNSMAKMGEILAAPLAMLADMISNSTILYGIMGAIGIIMANQIVASTMAFGKSLAPIITKLVSILTLESGIAAAKIAVNPWLLGAGLAAAGAVGYMISSATKAPSVKDADIDTTGKTPILSGDFGSVQLDPKDKLMYGADGNIKVGTDLLGKNEVGINPGGGNKGGNGGMNVDPNQMASIIAAAVAGAMVKVPLQVNTSVKLNERELTNGINNENNKISSQLP